LAFVKASPEAQLRLLELADLDTELGRLGHRRRTMPENAELAQLSERAAKVRDAITIADTNLADLDRELARELESLQNEVASLRRRQGDLEEGVLELMERRESAQALRDGAGAEAETVGGDEAGAAARRDAAVAEIDEQEAKAIAARTAIARDVPADLLALYDKIRASSGLGAAPLRRGQCGGCREMLSTVELNEVRAAPPDEVIRHEECRRILVRTADSGL
jgi:hypothetical protein